METKDPRPSWTLSQYSDFDAVFGLNRVENRSLYTKNAGRMNPLEGPREIALFALAHGARRQQAADDAGITVATLGRWLQDPDFAEELAQRRRDLLEPLSDEIRCTLADAFHVVRGNMMQTEDPKLAQRAAEFVIDRFGKSITDVAVGAPTTHVQINIVRGDLMAEARRRLAERNASQPSILAVESADDDD